MKFTEEHEACKNTDNSANEKCECALKMYRDDSDRWADVMNDACKRTDIS